MGTTGTIDRGGGTEAGTDKLSRALTDTSPWPCRAQGQLFLPAFGDSPRESPQPVERPRLRHLQAPQWAQAAVSVQRRQREGMRGDTPSITRDGRL
jgi:hypothetical protein